MNGMTAEQFKTYGARARKMSEDQLRYALNDLVEAIEICEAEAKLGSVREKHGFYLDEQHIYNGELYRRKR